MHAYLVSHDLGQETYGSCGFLIADLSCPPGANENAVICLKFQISREIQGRVIANAEIGFAFSAGRNHSFQLQEFRNDVQAGLEEASYEGTASAGEF